MAKVSAKGGFSLFLGVSLSTVISAVAVLLVAGLLSEGEYGLYTIAFIPPALFGLFRDWGINSAMIKYIAQYRSEDKLDEMRNVLASGLLFESAMGILLSILSFSLAGFLSTDVFNRPGTKGMIEIASVIILTNSLSVASQSTFVGFERMKFHSLTMIFQSCLKAVLAPLLVLLGYGTLGAVLGQVMSVLFTSILAVIIFYLVFYSKTQGSENDGLGLGRTLRSMLRYGLPLSVSTILFGFLLQFYNFLMVMYCSDSMIGNYSIALNFSTLITFFTIPIVTVLFPAFSKLDAEKEKGTLRNVFQSSVKYTALFTIPATTAIMVLSEPLVFTLFGQKYNHAPLFLTLDAVSFLYSGVGSLSLGSFLNGQGKTKLNMKLTILTISIGLPLSTILVPRFGITGLISTTLVAGIPSLFIGIWWIRKHFAVTVDWTSSTKIFLASAIAAAVTYVTASQLDLHYWTKLAIGGMIFLVTYLTSAPLIQAVNQTDINNLREMVSGLGPLSSIFNLLLNFMEKLIPTSKKT
jgi:O-antigen/teichoic acid export membrane protein